MATLPFTLYDAFSDTAFGGSQAGIITDAAWLDATVRTRIAREIGAPATGFVSATGNRSVSARFHSTVTEYGMCGHGTVALMTQMIEMGAIGWNESDRIDVELCLPAATTAVEIYRRDDGRALVMLDIPPPRFHTGGPDSKQLAGLLGLREQDFSTDLPLETATGNFVHLVVAVKNLAAMRRIEPDFNGLITFCHQHAIQTIAVFCTEVEQSGYNLHVRDFCPVVGVPESAAAGTTNAALTSYLVRHGVVGDNADGQTIVLAEQGHEIDRPSSIRSVVSMNGDSIDRLQVGGVATKLIEGQLHLPLERHCT